MGVGQSSAGTLPPLGNGLADWTAGWKVAPPLTLGLNLIEKNIKNV